MSLPEINSCHLMSSEKFPSTDHADDHSLIALNHLRPTIERIMALSGCAGASVGIIHQHKVAWTDDFGFSDVEAKMKPSSDTIYGIGSLTKAMVAACMGQIIDQGKAQWCTPVKDILPAFKQQDKELENNLTMVDLLSHRTGLTGFVPSTLAFQGDGEMLLPQKQLFPIFEDLRKIRASRTGWNYFAWGYSIVGAVISDLTGVSLSEYLQAAIFRPLEMRSTTTTPSTLASSTDVAKPYAALSDGTTFLLPHRQQFEHTFFEPSGGVYSNVKDMLKWSQEVLAHLQDSGQGSGRSTRMSSIAFTTSNHIAIENPSLRERSYGLGWIRTQLPNGIGLVGNALNVWSMENNPVFSAGAQSRLLIYHQGATVGYYSCLLLFPETGTAIVVLTNTAALNDTADWIARAFAEAVFENPHMTDYEDLARQSRDLTLSKYAQLQEFVYRGRQLDADPDKLESYAGRYWHGKMPFVIAITENLGPESELLLHFQALQSQTYRLRHYHHNVFEWSLSRDECARRGRYNHWDPGYFQMRFEAKRSGKFTKLTWAIDPASPEPETFIRQEDSTEQR